MSSHIKYLLDRKCGYTETYMFFIEYFLIIERWYVINNNVPVDTSSENSNSMALGKKSGPHARFPQSTLPC
jgi:hypothetical protein